MNSAIFTGGWEQLIAAFIGAAVLLCFYPADADQGWARWRVAAFFLGWQAFTPLREWYVDLPLLLVCTLLMEVVYRTAARRYLRKGKA